MQNPYGLPESDQYPYPDNQAPPHVSDHPTEDLSKKTTPTVTVLHGHTSQETAYVVNDYPYGFRLRCKIRYWIERAAKGEKKGQVRFMSQTTNPKVSGEVWNKPKGSTYAAFGAMYLDEQGHVQWRSLGYYMWPEHVAEFKSSGIYAQLNDVERAEIDGMVALSRATSPISWGEWDAKQQKAEIPA